ncbi:hypothetical protein KIH39_00140 [Telmatocola sphagniphila]|uniref:Uncharacterized protein n=1 Tax=Telmatocola sphagniphila TaxID=1123043 RepID=A0A8E6B6V2_9BACT|nr:hypothetical protein [Telmatocola sphagniphila]QVL32364.1 hypothetical protein KIH39_00140 [Telmatocola sphagniphila]
MKIQPTSASALPACSNAFMQLSSSLWTLADLRRRPLWLRIDPYFNGTRGEFTLQGAKFARQDPDAFEPEPAILPQEGERYYLIGAGDFEILIRIESSTGKREKTYYFVRV